MDPGEGIPGPSGLQKTTSSVVSTEEDIFNAEFVFPDNESNFTNEEASSLIFLPSGAPSTSSILEASNCSVQEVQYVNVVDQAPTAPVVFVDSESEAGDFLGRNASDPSANNQMEGGGYGGEFGVVETQDVVVEEDDEAEEEIVVYMDDEEMAVDDNIPVSYENALVLNETYQNTLHELMENLEISLRENRVRQKELASEINDLEAGRKLVEGGSQEEDLNNPLHIRAEDIPLADTVMKKTTLSVFAAPYFKDVNFFSHPDNPDTERKKCSDELDVYLQNPREWTRVDKKKLTQAIKGYAKEELLTPLKRSAKKLQGKIHDRFTTDQQKEEINKKLAKLKREETNVHDLTDLELVGDRSKEHDWMRISAFTFNNQLSPVSCRLMWQNLLHVSINRSKWSGEETKDLTRLVKEEAHNYRCVDWERVARNLKTNRTSVQCLIKFKQAFVSQMERQRWSLVEDDRLILLVEDCRINNYIPWSKVAYFMLNRTKDQCYQRFSNSLKPCLRRGTFTDAEDCIILAGEMIYNTQWYKIADFIPSRNPDQIRARYHNFLKADFNQFTKQEDAELLKLVKEFGSSDWAQIAKILRERLNTNKRTRQQCRIRFMKLYKLFMQDTENFSLSQLHKESTRSEAKEKEDTLSTRRQKAVYAMCEERINQFLNKIREEGCEDELEIYQDTDVVVTDSGVRIPKTVMIKFLQSLKPELPAMPGKVDTKSLRNKFLDPNLPKPYKFNPVKDNNSAERGPGRPGRKPTAASPAVHYSPNNYALNLDRQLATTFRPSWPYKRNKNKSYKSNYMKLLNRGTAYYSKVLKFEKPDASKISAEALASNPILTGFIESKEDESPALFHPSASPCSTSASKEHVFKHPLPRQHSQPSPATLSPGGPGVGGHFSKPALKTYSRKRRDTSQAAPPPPASKASTASKAESATSSLPKDVPMIPPNYESMIGFRGTLLHMRHVKKLFTRADAEKSSGKKDGRAIKGFGSGIKTPLDKIAKEGINHVDLFVDHDTFKPPTEASQNPAVAKADRLLKERFLSVFFWPAVLSSVERQDEKVAEDLFLGSTSYPADMATSSTDQLDRRNESLPMLAHRQMTFGSLSTSFIKEEMAAADPMDVTQIIEEAKVKVQSGPRVRYVVKANPRPAKVIQPPVEEPPLLICNPPVSDQQQPSTREEEVTKSLPSVAPPPPKKRLLATLKRENKLPGGKGVTFKEPLTETDT